MNINVTLDGASVAIEYEVFKSLFEQSVASDRPAVRNALASGSINYRTLVGLSRLAEIPYPLFFAPLDHVKAQLEKKSAKLMAGFTRKTSFAVNSRNRVNLADVELIVKDLQRKQQYIKRDKFLAKNEVVGSLKARGKTISDDSARLMETLDLDPTDLRRAKSKEAALDLLIGKLEGRRVLVSQGARNYMPQQIPKGTRFSGMTIADSRVPYIFLAGGDEGERVEPAGRRVFTLTLLAVLVARGIFATVTYNGHSSDEAAPQEWRLAAEILMPAADFRESDLNGVSAVREVAGLYKVTPSAVVVRARHLGMLGGDEATLYLEELRTAYEEAPRPRTRSPFAVNALRKYNGRECSRRMLALLDAGGMTTGDFCRVMFLNKLRGAESISEFRRAVA